MGWVLQANSDFCPVTLSLNCRSQASTPLVQFSLAARTLGDRTLTLTTWCGKVLAGRLAPVCSSSTLDSAFHMMSGTWACVFFLLLLPLPMGLLSPLFITFYTGLLTQTANCLTNYIVPGQCLWFSLYTRPISSVTWGFYHLLVSHFKYIRKLLYNCFWLCKVHLSLLFSNCYCVHLARAGQMQSKSHLPEQFFKAGFNPRQK